MARPSPLVPDGARARLRALGDPPAVVGDRPERWGPQETVEVGERGGAGRVGWPGAPQGTPAARLRLPPRSGASRTRGDDESWEDETPPVARGSGWWDDEDDESVRPAARGSAWDPPEPGERARRWLGRWVPASWAGARWDPGRTGALALAAVAAVAAVVAAVGVWAGRPVAEPVPALPAVAGPSSATAGPLAVPGAAPADAGPIVVSVSGRVTRPGLVRLPPGSRVGDAVEAAGGAAPDADMTGLNLAARLSDGEQVVVGVPAPAAPAGAAAGGAPAGAPANAAAGAPGGGGRVDLNTATLEQLDQLPGVGPVTAQRILEWRTQNGRFGAVEQLQEVSGIGDARFATLRDLVTV
ncbi:helix-hairpin-helix domain-containing protein [Actinomycetospora sp. C-140]